MVERFRPAVVSDHLSWSNFGGRHGHDLLPLPMTRAVAARVAERVREVQDALGCRLALENVSAYLRTREDELPEWEFLALVADRADAAILLDVNNVYVNARNFGDDAGRFIDQVPSERIVQYHLGGHTDLGSHVVDTHATAMIDPVLDLFARAVERHGPRPTIVEWDADLPSLDTLLAERERAEAIVVGARTGAT